MNQWKRYPAGLALAVLWMGLAGMDAPPAQAGALRIVSLGTTSSVVVDHNAFTGDDRGGIALSGSHVFYTGDSQSARFSSADLTGGTGLGFGRDGLVSNLATGVVYTLGASGVPLVLGGGAVTVTELIELDGTTLVPTGGTIPLSIGIPVNTSAGGSGLFSGSDRIALHNGTDVYGIQLPAGTTTNLGAVPLPAYPCESWAAWGVVEGPSTGAGSIRLVYRSGVTGDVERVLVPSGATETVSSFPLGLGDLCSFVVSPTANRWYFHYEGSTATFGGTSETIGLADAVLATSSADVDGDGIEDAFDNCPAIGNPAQEDADLDGIGDVCDTCTDLDGDGGGEPGFPANTCPLDNCPGLSNPGQGDADGDLFGDPCDLCTDTDGDGAGDPGFPASTCAADNCPGDANLDQADGDLDGVGTVCDPSDAPLNVTRLTWKPNKGGVARPNGVVQVAGDFYTDTLAPAFDVLTDLNGISATISEQLGASVATAPAFTAGDCTVSTSGKILCKSADKKMKAQFKRISSGGPLQPWVFQIKLTKQLPAGPFYAPASVAIRYGSGVDRAGSISSCAITAAGGIACKVL